jgi:hypothetical protein
MANFAQLNEQNIVSNVIIVNNKTIDNLPFPESEPVGSEFCKSLYGAETIWKQTSYNSNFRKNYAGIGFTYSNELDAFISPKPYSSWLLNTQTAKWEAPIPYPTDGNHYLWSENTLSWVEG